MANHALVRIDCAVGHETAKALNITVEDENKWVPLSQITEIHRQDGWIMVAEWWARKEGLL